MSTAYVRSTGTLISRGTVSKGRSTSTTRCDLHTYKVGVEQMFSEVEAGGGGGGGGIGGEGG